MRSGERLRMVLVGAVCAGGTLFLAGLGVQPRPEQREPEETRSPLRAVATMPDAAFMVGSWSATRKDRFTQEVWTEAKGGRMLGMFRWTKPDGEPVVYELMTLSENNGALEMRISHFNAELATIDSLKDVIVLEVTEKAEGRLVFGVRKNPQGLDRIIYSAAGDSLRIELKFVQDQERPRQPLVLEMSKR